MPTTPTRRRAPRPPAPRNELLPGTDSPFAPPEQFHRPLRVYAFDPGHGTRFGNHMTVRVPYERLRPGPVGRRVAVIDYDGANGCFYPPVDLDDPQLLLQGGLAPTDSDPRFHQQMAYAVVSHTLATFDRALGREVKFAFGPSPRNRTHLKVFPHGICEANAYYSRALHGLVFGYFAASSDEPGHNIPGQPVYTCLSHDILVHETAHAVIDGMRSAFMDPTNPDTLAFHEGLADLIALFQHFTFPEALVETLRRTGGRLFRDSLEAVLGREPPPEGNERNPLVELARQFGEALGTRRALRSAIGQVPSREVLQVVFEPHERGAILVAAVFDAFFEVYAHATRDLFRIAGRLPQQGEELQTDLALRLAKDAASIASGFLRLCIQALEYCPPVDLQLGDYLRAMVTVHGRVDPDDAHGVREALIRAFGRRGIYPPDVTSLSERTLFWQPPDDRLPRFTGFEFGEVLGSHGDPSLSRRNALRIHAFASAHRRALGLEETLPIAVKAFHKVRMYGAGLDGAELVVELLQRQEVPLGSSKTETLEVRGGTTLVFRADGTVRYAISKRLSEARSRAQVEFGRAYLGNHAAALYGAAHVGPRLTADLQSLHRGY